MKAKRQSRLQLKINNCCGVQPQIAFNKREALGIYCPRCKRFMMAVDDERILELVKKWNESGEKNLKMI